MLHDSQELRIAQKNFDSSLKLFYRSGLLRNHPSSSFCSKRWLHLTSSNFKEEKNKKDKKKPKKEEEEEEEDDNKLHPVVAKLTLFFFIVYSLLLLLTSIAAPAGQGAEVSLCFL